jgi:hypothetical protein
MDADLCPADGKYPLYFIVNKYCTSSTIIYAMQ